MANNDVFAIFSTGGKQYRVKVGDTIKVEKLDADKIGNPTVNGAKVLGDVVAQTRAKKVIIFKRKRRHNYRRTRGHRQYLTVVKITAIK